MADALLLDPNDLQPDAAPGIDEIEALLAQPRVPDVVIPQRELAEHRLQEAIFDEAKHPRWPKGTKNAKGENIGGKFMRAGQTFMLNGKRWEIHSIADGRIIADEASGKIEAAETRVFEPGTATIDGAKVPVLKGAKYAEPWVLQSGQGKFEHEHNTPVVESETHPESHDPKIKVPAGSDLNAEEWKRFGRADQLYYVELMSRYGQWHYADKKLTQGAFLHSKAEEALKKAQEQLHDYDIAATLKTAFASQKGSSKGYDLDFASLFKSLVSYGQSKSQIAQVWTDYEHVREAERDLNAVIAWDLYNRLRAPDVSLRHRSQNDTGWWQDVILGKTALMSGPSSHWSVNFAWHDPNSLGYVTPIRNLAMFTDIVGYEGDYGEHEVATANRMKLTADTAAFWTPGQMQEEMSNPLWKWLKGQMGAKPAGGHVMRAFAAHLLGKGDLPLPPPDADFAWIHQPGTGEKTYEIPPDDFMAKVEAAIAKNPGVYVGGVTDPEQAAKPISELALKPGDVVEGSTPGLRYLVIKDTSGTMGLSYLALGKGIAGNYDTSDKKYTFGSSESKRKKIDLHFDIPAAKPKPKSKEPVYSQADWKPEGDKLPVKQFEVGDKLRFNQDDWQVTSKSPTLVTLKSMTTGGEGTVNAGWPTQKLVPVKPFEPVTGALVLVSPHGGKQQIGRVAKVGKQSAQVLMPNGETKTWVKGMLAAAPSYAPNAPSKGDTFSKDGQKYVVTNVLKKNKHVKARAAKAGATVEDFPPDHPALESLFRPDDYALGGKAKVGQVSAGSLVSGSLTAKRPYMVLGAAGAHAWLVNLDTGEQVQVGKNKSYPLLLTANEAADVAPMVGVAGQKPKSAWAIGDAVNGMQLGKGDLFTAGSGPGKGETYQVTDAEPGTMKVNNTGSAGYHPFPLTPSGKEQWWYAGHSDEIQGAPAPSAPVASSTAALPTASFVPFKSNYGPSAKYKHNKLNEFNEGQLVYDKSGALWKVKQAGATPIITDGTTNFQIDGALKGKAYEHAAKQHPFSDNSPPVNGDKEQLDQMTPNVLGKSLADLKLTSGDQFSAKGQVWTVTTTGGKTLLGAENQAGTESVLKSVIPSHYAKKSGSVANTEGKTMQDLVLHDGDQVKLGSSWYTIGGDFGTHKGHKEVYPTATGGFLLGSHVPLEIQYVTVPPEAAPDLFTKADGTVAANTLAPMSVAETKQGETIYKSFGGEWFPLGSAAKSKVKTAQVFPVTVNKPDVSGWEPGPEMPLDDAPVGSVVQGVVNGKTYLVLAHGKDGTHGMVVGSGEIAFGSTGPKVQVLVPPSGAAPAAPQFAYPKDMEVGTLYKTSAGSVVKKLADVPDGKIKLEMIEPSATSPKPKGVVWTVDGAPMQKEVVGYEPSDSEPGEWVDLPSGTKLNDIALALQPGDKFKSGSGKTYTFKGGVPGAWNASSSASGPIKLTGKLSVTAKQSPGWVPQPGDPTSFAWAPGDQFKTVDGDVHTVISAKPGQVETTWQSADGPTFGPMTFYAGELQAAAAKYGHDGEKVGAAVAPQGLEPGDVVPLNTLKRGDVWSHDAAGEHKWKFTGEPWPGPTNTLMSVDAKSGTKSHTDPDSSVHFWSGPSGQAPADAKTAAGAEDGWVSVTGDHQTADSLGLGVGDQFTNSAGTFKIDAFYPHAGYLKKYSSTNVNTGKEQMWGNPTVVSYKKATPGDLGAAVTKAIQDAPLPSKPKSTTNKGVIDAFLAHQPAKSKSMHTELLANGDMMLYSYDTPIAWHGANEEVQVTSGKAPSVTTAKHRTQALDAALGQGKTAAKVSPSDLGQLEPKSAENPPETPKPPEVGAMVSPNDLNVGDKFMNNSGGVFLVTSKDGTFLGFKKLSGPGSASGNQALVTPVKWKLYEKAKFKPGDSVEQGQLQPGDTFSFDPGGTEYQVIKPDGSGWHVVQTDGHGAKGSTAWAPADKKVVLLSGPSVAAPSAIKTFDVAVTPTGSAGGTTGAQWATGEHGEKFIVKDYGGDQNRVATEALANAIYQKLGVNVAAGGLIGGSDITYGDPGTKAFIAPVVSGQIDTAPWTDQQKESFAKDYVADALLGSYDNIGLDRDNVLWQNSGAASDALTPVRVDQGGTFRYRAQGKLKEYGPVPDDLWTMLTKGQAGSNGLGAFLSENELRAQAGKIAGALTPSMVDGLVDAAPFADQKMSAEIRSNLKSRLNWLTAFAHGGGPIPADVKKLLASNESAKDEGLPLVPYGSKWASGGAFTYPEVSSLQKGQQFRDKNGKLFTVDGQTFTTVELAGGFGPMDNVTLAIPQGGSLSDKVVIPHKFTDAKTGKVKLTRVKLVNA